MYLIFEIFNKVKLKKWESFGQKLEVEHSWKLPISSRFLIYSIQILLFFKLS